MPDDEQEIARQVAATAALVAERRHLGDHPESPRVVEHVAFFRTHGRAESAAGDLQQLGFAVTSVERRGLRVAATFSRTDRVDEAAAEAFTRQAVGVVLRHGGSYDGWGAYLDESGGSAP